jgi:hypothetical protein
MALTNTPLPFGLRDVKIRPFAPGTEVAGAAVDLPNARTFSFSEAEDFQELRGDDGLVAVHGQGAAVDWSLESGGVPFEAVKAMFGGTITETGVTPSQIKTFSKGGHDIRPYFQVEGQAISDSGGDCTTQGHQRWRRRCHLCRCLADISRAVWLRHHVAIWQQGPPASYAGPA